MAKKLLVLFGATGSLSRLKIFPALSNLYLNNELGSDVKILAYGRKEFDSQTFRKYLSDIPNLNQNFIMTIDYLVGDTLGPTNLLDYISENKIEKVYCYLSLPPNLYSQTIDFIGKFVEGLNFRIALEKPFGTSLSEAILLAGKIKDIDADRFYLVDHYLAKKAIINFPTIDINLVTKIEASIFEEDGVEGRETFYDQTGAAVDTVQSHILNTLAKFDTNLLEGVNYKPGTLVLGQYDGYRDLPGINPASKTETYFKAEFKYKDVNITVRSGKALDKTKVFLSVSYKNGERSDIIIKPNPNEIRSPHEYVIKDFLEDKRKFSVSASDALLSWRIIDAVFKDGDRTKIRYYSKGSDFGNIEA